MKDYTAEIRNQVLELWGKTLAQFEEHDRLLKRLGEEVFRLIEAGALVVPSPVLPIYQRLKRAIEKLVVVQPSGPVAASAARPVLPKAKAPASKATAGKKTTAKKKAASGKKTASPKKTPAKKPARKKTANKAKARTKTKPAVQSVSASGTDFKST